MDVLIKTHPQDDPVYQFLDKKRAQKKPYYVYMTAGANKFLRIYYGRVKEVGTNFECGISLTNCNDLKVGDVIETYEEVEVKQTL